MRERTVLKIAIWIICALTLLNIADASVSLGLGIVASSCILSLILLEIFKNKN